MGGNQSKSKPKPKPAPRLSIKSEPQPSIDTSGKQIPLEAIISQCLRHYKIHSVILATALKTVGTAAADGSRVVPLLDDCEERPQPAPVSLSSGELARNLLGVQGDAQLMHPYLLRLKESLKGRHPDIYLVECNLVIQRQLEGKKHMMKQLNAFFNVEAETDHVLFIIYYTGHGCNPNGNWAIARPSYAIGYDVITLDEILNLWEERYGVTFRKGSSLLILSDSCHSGAWVEQLEAKKKAERDKQRDPDDEAAISKVSMVASCGPREMSRGDRNGGYFTKYLLRGENPRCTPMCTKDITLEIDNK